MMKMMMSMLGLMCLGTLMNKIVVWVILGWLIMYMLMLIAHISLYESYKLLSSWNGLDNLSYVLMLLSVFLVLLMYLASTYIYMNSNFTKMYSFFKLLLMMSLMLSFTSTNFLMFYIFFEISLIPTLFIIMGWGHQPERLKAGVYFMMYTLFSSLPLLMGLIYLMMVKGFSTNFVSLSMLELSWLSHYNGGVSWLMGFILIFAFLVKLPMFLTHLWLPQAHVEAPVAGSMVLAGVLLKLGGYGLSRMVMNMPYLIKVSFGELLVSLSLIGMIFISLVCCRMNDLKALVAYSSVAHMGVVICGVITGFAWGLNGGLMMMVGHGLSSSSLFCMVNMFYERAHSRSIYLNKGFINLIPVFSLLFFLLCCSNISAPPSINLLSEINLMVSLMGFHMITMIVFPLGSFLGAVFTFYMFSFTQHGKYYSSVLNTQNTSFLELHVVLMHILSINILILLNSILFNWV